MRGKASQAEKWIRGVTNVMEGLAVEFTAGVPGAGVAAGVGVELVRETALGCLEWFTHEKRDQELLKSFQTSLKEHEEIQKRIEIIEAGVESLIYIQTLIDHMSGKGQLVTELKTLHGRIEELLEELEGVQKRNSESEEMLKAISGDQIRLTELLTVLDRLTRKLRTLDEAGVCNLLKQGTDQLFTEDAAIQARRVVLASARSMNLYHRALMRKHKELAKLVMEENSLAGRKKQVANETETMNIATQLLVYNHTRGDAEVLQMLLDCEAQLSGCGWGWVVTAKMRQKCARQIFDLYKERFPELEQQLKGIATLRSSESSALVVVRPSALVEDMAIFKRQIDGIRNAQTEAQVNARFEKLKDYRQKMQAVCSGVE